MRDATTRKFSPQFPATRWPQWDGFDRLVKVLESNLDLLMDDLKSKGLQTTKGSTAKLVLLALARRGGNEDFCYPGLDALAAFASVKGEAVTQAIRALVDARLVTKHERKGIPGAGRYEQTNLYELHWDRIDDLPRWRDVADAAREDRRRARRYDGQQYLHDSGSNRKTRSHLARETRSHRLGKPDHDVPGKPETIRAQHALTQSIESEGIKPSMPEKRNGSEGDACNADVRLLRALQKVQTVEGITRSRLSDVLIALKTINGRRDPLAFVTDVIERSGRKRNPPAYVAQSIIDESNDPTTLTRSNAS